MGNITPNSRLFIRLQLVTAATTNYIKNRQIERLRNQHKTAKSRNILIPLMIINQLAIFWT